MKPNLFQPPHSEIRSADDELPVISLRSIITTAAWQHLALVVLACLVLDGGRGQYPEKALIAALIHWVVIVVVGLTSSRQAMHTFAAGAYVPLFVIVVAIAAYM